MATKRESNLAAMHDAPPGAVACSCGLCGGSNVVLDADEGEDEEPPIATALDPGVPMDPLAMVEAETPDIVCRMSFGGVTMHVVKPFDHDFETCDGCGVKGRRPTPKGLRPCFRCFYPDEEPSLPPEMLAAALRSKDR